MQARAETFKNGSAWYGLIDKAEWGEGPWQSEPDKAEWHDERTGLPCILLRGTMGQLCGYVAVPPGHVAHGRGYASLDDLDCHGGVTYSGGCEAMPEDDAEEHIDILRVCHTPKPGEPDDVWWVGFDCAHLGDLTPRTALLNQQLAALRRPTGWQSYKDTEYVVLECTNLAARLAAMQGS